MEFERGAILRAAAQGDLELAWQVRELGMDGGPLPDDFRKNAWILDFICRRAGEMIGGDIAYAVAARLQRSASASGTSTSLIQLNWMFCRVVKWP